MKVVIPVFKGCVSASVVGMMDMLQLTQNFYNHLPGPKKPWFEVQLVSLEAEKNVQNNGFEIACHLTLEQCQQADLVIVPAMIGDFQQLIDEHQLFIDWLKKQYQQGMALSSTCSGVFFLAATGYLDGQEATTSWFAVTQFRKLFPQVKLMDEKIIVDNGKMVTGGATLSFQNLCIYLIEKYYGVEIGNYAAKMFLVDKGKHNQMTYSIFSDQKNHNDDTIADIQKYIEQNAAKKLIVSELAEKALLAERTFIRRFKTATGNTPSEYI